LLLVFGDWEGLWAKVWGMPGVELAPKALSPAQFDRVRQLLYRVSRIDLQPGKERLVEGRLNSHLRRLGLPDFDAYLHHVENDRSGAEVAMMVDSLTTNKTHFFREEAHFDYLRQQVLPETRPQGRPLRFWCAGCSTGEEPFSLAILLRQEFPEIDRLDVRILATDISDRVLETARQATYPLDRLQEVPPTLLRRYFAPLRNSPGELHQLSEQITGLVCFARLNLMGAWPMKGPFDVIFCRNVMIYFDVPTRQELVRRFYSLLRPGGHLFIGHSESINGYPHQFRYVQPATYQK
jgi:chemotaxis protein methyltransferase CheR